MSKKRNILKCSTVPFPGPIMSEEFTVRLVSYLWLFYFKKMSNIPSAV